MSGLGIFEKIIIESNSKQNYAWYIFQMPDKSFFGNNLNFCFEKTLQKVLFYYFSIIWRQ